MRLIMIITFASVFASNALAAHAQDVVAAAAPAPLTVEAINAARIDTLSPDLPLPTTDEPATTAEKYPDPAVVRLQILLDQGGASPGVIDGFDGENVRKAIIAFEAMRGLPVDGTIDPDVIAALETGQPVVGEYAVTAEDAAAIVAPIPADYAEKATRDFLGYESVAEELAERFHMDIDLLKALNPSAGFAEGERIVVAAYGPNLTGEVARIEADKSLRQLRAYDANDRLIAAYPATIGSEDNPSPSGTHVVEAIAPMPNYTYNPKINFQQGENTEVLTIPPGPNGPVGSMWIDLSEPTFGIHGTPEPSLIDKVASHGCVRLTNWDAEELSTMVKPGVTVTFTG
jgi:lipoprotein-anchoring transpeptidase ErfK/SrfK